MEESIFEWMERSGIVDAVLLYAALIAPLVVALTAALMWRRQAVQSCLNRWILAALACPVIYGLWKAYNAIADHYGLDSVFGLFVNACMFAITAIVLVVLNTGLKIMISRHRQGGA